MSSSSSNLAAPEAICLECGLCCNGVIFAKVKLQPVDSSTALRRAGLKLKPATAKGALQFSQPCAALDGCRCRIYADRPKYCREFDCLLLKQVQAGEMRPAAALTVIREARKSVERVHILLRKLGDGDDRLPLRARFSRTTRRLERSGLVESTGRTYSQLTLAVHELNLLLSKRFYPGP